jgi:hypothetical protein
MARPTLDQQRIRNTKKAENEELFQFKLKLCYRFHRMIVKARRLPEEERYKYLEDYLQKTIEQMY